MFKNFLEIRQRINMYKVKLEKTKKRIQGTLQFKGEVIEAQKSFLEKEEDKKNFGRLSGKKKTFSDLVGG